MKELLELYLIFAKIGSVNFGGGYAMLPLLERELVTDRGWVTTDELMDYFAIGQCTPGIIALNVSTFIGNKRKGLNARQKAVLKRYREALELARRPAFAEGRTFDLCYCQGDGFDPDRHFAFLRADEAETWLVVANFGPAADITVRIPAEAGAEPRTVTLRVPSQDFVAEKL